ncbi:nuclear transport factor 2 family protein [Agromyces aerolatus]|uniref:nuclear transport factor 2 family protein n=1 Tax=Agromyces sp. LY-1074 TaxID=3074080 RepID=UPI00285907C4|nr:MULTISPECIES: nuclear transport factor 2 family protein [unclassified Agromyces]MDR5699131.1 nuclear transport factor 2 family protein [Agromyces sp. LY-1074]MDR5705090.1 nuclear transport factor 2 family protein [Agromyces sp. LY-1358]
MVAGVPAEVEPQVEIALGFHRTLEAGDFDAFEALFTTDAVNELPFHSPVSPAQFVGAAAIAADYRKMISKRRELEFTIHTVTTDAAANRVVLEFSGRSIIGETGALYEQDYVGVFTIDGTQVSLLRLYADPQRAAKALEPIR